MLETQICVTRPQCINNSVLRLHLYCTLYLPGVLLASALKAECTINPPHPSFIFFLLLYIIPCTPRYFSPYLVIYFFLPFPFHFHLFDSCSVISPVLCTYSPFFPSPSFPHFSSFFFSFSLFSSLSTSPLIYHFHNFLRPSFLTSN